MKRLNREAPEQTLTTTLEEIGKSTVGKSRLGIEQISIVVQTDWAAANASSHFRIGLHRLPGR